MYNNVCTQLWKPTKDETSELCRTKSFCFLIFMLPCTCKLVIFFHLRQHIRQDT